MIKQVIKGLLGRLKYNYKKLKDFSSFCSEKEYMTGVSFGQNFEDLILLKLIKELNPEKGFFVDVGAHDPIRFSNTYSLHKRGWQGINIDPLPTCIERFKTMRPNDINLNIGVSDKEGSLEYFDFEEPAYNTINPLRAKYVLENSYTKLKGKCIIKIDTLKNILDKYINGRTIDLLTIDVETMELSVLQSNDWVKYRPRFIVMESIVNVNESLDNIYKDPAVHFLIDKQYVVVAKVANAVFFRNLL